MTTMFTTRTGRCDARIDALRAEFGGMLAERILDAEAADFLWQSRVRERYLGQHFGVIDAGVGTSEDVSRVAFLSVLDERWHAGICLVDAEAAALELLWKQSFLRFEDAEIAFLKVR